MLTFSTEGINEGLSEQILEPKAGQMSSPVQH